MSCFLSSYQGAKMSLCGAAECLCKDNDYGGGRRGLGGVMGLGVIGIPP